MNLYVVSYQTNNISNNSTTTSVVNAQKLSLKNGR